MGDSLRRQLENARRWAYENGYGELDETHRDLGISAFKGANRTTGALSRFVESINSGDIKSGSVLIVESLDRLSRDEISKTLTFFLQILGTGVSIVTLSDGKHYTQASMNDLGDIITSIVIMSRAHEESAIKSERGRNTFAEKRKLAATIKKPFTSVTPAWLRLNKKTQKFEVNNERAKVVQRIYEMSVEGMGTTSIVKKLNEDKVPVFGRAKNGWRDSYVLKILRSRSVIGEFLPHIYRDGKRVSLETAIQDYFPAIIDDTLFHRVQAALNKRGNETRRRGAAFNNVLTGIALCEHCGNPMRYINKTKSKISNHYLQCSSNIRSAGCTNNIKFRYEFVESIVLNTTAHQTNWHKQLLNNNSEIKTIENELEAAKQMLDDVNNRLNRYLHLFETASDDAVKDAQHRYEQIVSEKKTLNEQISLLESQLISGASETSEYEKLHELLADIIRERIDAAEEGGSRLYALNAKLNNNLKKGIKAAILGKDGIQIQLKNGSESMPVTSDMLIFKKNTRNPK